MAENTLYDDLKEVLEDFKKFLDENKDVVKPAVAALAALTPKIVVLISETSTFSSEEINLLNRPQSKAPAIPITLFTGKSLIL